jgi:hypothetical protein
MRISFLANLLAHATANLRGWVAFPVQEDCGAGGCGIFGGEYVIRTGVDLEHIFDGVVAREEADEQDDHADDNVDESIKRQCAYRQRSIGLVVLKIVKFSGGAVNVVYQTPMELREGHLGP